MYHVSKFIQYPNRKSVGQLHVHFMFDLINLNNVGKIEYTSEQYERGYSIFNVMDTIKKCNNYFKNIKLEYITNNKQENEYL